MRSAADISPIMQMLSAYIARALRRSLPRPVVERAKLHLLDTLSAIVSGSQLLPGQRAIAFARAQGGKLEAQVIGSDFVTSAINAALANGMHAHSDETDDTYYAALVHPGCSIVPAALAMAERERRSGRDLLRAMVLGYDVCARTSKALGLEKLRSAGHSTHSISGTFGCAAAAGALAGVDARQARYLLSYASQQASGLSCWARDTEHIEKAFDFGGMPARNGVTAAVMTSMQFTGVEDVFAGDRGLFHTYERFADPERLVAKLGDEYEIMNTAIKRWAVGYPIQAPLDAVSNLIVRHGVRATDVKRVTVTIDEQGARTVNRRKMADINIQHLVAMMLIDGDVTFASSHDNARLRDPAVARLREHITLEGSAVLLRAKTTQAIVEIETQRGEHLRHHTKAVRGTATNPMSREEVAAKSEDLLVPVLGRRRAMRLIDRLWTIDRMQDVRALRPLLEGRDT